MQQSHTRCADSDNDGNTFPALPRNARLSLNRCNLPAVILGSLTFQRHPAPLHLDGVAELHARFFQALAGIDQAEERARHFQAYMDAHFSLHALEEAGLDLTKKGRGKADYLRLLRGWLFDADGRDAAVIKGWVESRFGLLTRHHKGPIHSPDTDEYRHFLEARVAGLYATNALEAQLDLVYEFCQYEAWRRHRDRSHITLFRGVNRLDHHESLATLPNHRRILLLNNINSFTSSRERAEEFGDHILCAEVPLAKIFFFNRLLPGVLKGEDEFMVIGGLYEVGFC